MLDHLPQRQVPFTSDELSYINSLQYNLGNFVWSMRSPRIEDLYRAINADCDRVGVNRDKLMWAMHTAHEAVCGAGATRDEAVDFLKPLLNNDAAFSQHAYDYMQLAYALEHVVKARAIDRLAALEPSDPQPAEAETRLKDLLKSFGHGGWEAGRMVERLYEAIDEHSKAYMMGRGR